jgi:hypothetical protein
MLGDSTGVIKAYLPRNPIITINSNIALKNCKIGMHDDKIQI